MLNKAKIGDKVYHYQKERFQDLIITKINGKIITCRGKEYTKVPYTTNYEWKDIERDFTEVELAKEVNINGETLTKENKWYHLLEFTPNMAMRLIDIYRYWLNEEIDLNTFYQRDLVWSKKQKLAYIMAIFEKGIETKPTFIVNVVKDPRLEVLDGKQRITTLLDFIEDKIKLENGKVFSELSEKDKETILFHQIRYTRIIKQGYNNDLTDKEKVELFLEINELGTKMSDKHIEKIKEEYLEKQ